MADFEKDITKGYTSSSTGSTLQSPFEQSIHIESGGPSLQSVPRFQWFKPQSWGSDRADRIADRRKKCEDTKKRRSVTKCLDTCPAGYPQLSTLQASDPNFLQFRGFGVLHVRLLLSLQYDVEAVERELDELDIYDKSQGKGDKLQCRERDLREKHQADINGIVPDLRNRPDVLADLQKRLMHYDEVLLRTRDIVALQRPSNKDWKSVRDWIFDIKPLVDGEQAFILKKEDIVTLRVGRECAGLDTFIEWMLGAFDRVLSKHCNCKIIQHIFRTQELQEKSCEQRINYYAPARVDKLVNLVITAVIFVLLVLPVVAMYRLSNLAERSSPFAAIAILIIFTLLFGMTMSSLTKATRQELFAASAAYCAVLVVFISNFSTQTVVIA